MYDIFAEEKNSQLTFLPLCTDCDNYVAQKNDFIECRQDLTLLECKFLRLMMMQVKPDATHFDEYVFSVKELASVLGSSHNPSNLYHRGKLMTESIMKKHLEVREPDGSWEKRQWVESCRYDKQTSKFTVRLNDKLLPFLVGLGGKKAPFNQYAYRQIKEFNSYSAIRIFELLTKNIKGSESNLDALDPGGYKIMLTKQQIIDACMLYKKDSTGQFIKKNGGRRKEDEYVPAYERISQFKEKVIKKACREITKHSDWYVPYDESDLELCISPKQTVRYNGCDIDVKKLMRVDDIKDGHEIVAFNFYITHKNNLKHFRRILGNVPVCQPRKKETEQMA